MIEMGSEEKEYLPKIHYFGTVPSCMDVAFELVNAGRLGDWDSVQASMQTAGRGQMRRKWISLPGNLFVALKLPMVEPFNSPAAAVAIGTLCASALRASGCPVMMKWPNDLVMIDENDELTKVGGILVEEKNNSLIAGIGINVNHAPEEGQLEADEDGLKPASLPASCKKSILPEPEEFWRYLVKHIYSIYKNGPVFSSIWRNLADELLLWRGLKVCLLEGQEKCEGILLGIADNGGAILKTHSGVEEKLGGTMRLPDAPRWAGKE